MILYFISGRAIEEVHAVLSEIAVAAELDMEIFRKDILFTESFRMSVKINFYILSTNLIAKGPLPFASITIIQFDH